MKNSKSIKILTSVLILILGLIFTTVVNAGYNYNVFKEDVPNHLSGGRYKPHKEGNFWMYCREAGGRYGGVTLSREDYNIWANKGFRTPAEGSEYECDKSGTIPWTGYRTTMYYEQGDKVESKLTKGAYQEAAYILATAVERGQLESMDTAHSIWAAEVNLGNTETPGNALYQEANAYRTFYQKLQRKSFKDRVKDKTDYTDTNPAVLTDTNPAVLTDTNPAVLVNQDNETYTIGKFKVYYLTGNYEFTANQEGSDNIVENEEVIINLFKKAVQHADDVHTSRYKNDQNKDIFIYTRNNATTLLAQYNANNSSVTWKEMQATRKELIKAQKNLVLKSGKTDDRKYENEPEETTTSVTKKGNFSYIKSIEVIGLDINNREVNNSISDKQVINQQGNKLWDVDKDGNQINVPKSNEEFYINFKVTKESVKKIKLKVTFEWLDSCYAEAYEFNGKERQWYWERITTDKVCCTFYTKCSDLGHTTSNCPTNTPDKHNQRNTYKWYYHLTSRLVDARQKLLGLEGTKAGKNWKTCDLMLNKDQPIDITMELGGYVFLDKDEDKVNAGDNTLNDKAKEVIPGAEVWLYEKGTNKFVGITTTNGDGYYKFEKLNAMKKYYVKFVYNGMLYTDVAYNVGNPKYNEGDWNITSKATENSGEREAFNKKFEEIGSYPANYRVTNQIFNDNIYTKDNNNYKYNKTYSQVEIADIFKALTKEIVKQKGNVNQACNILAQGKDDEYKRKLQFAVDCRISAYTNGDTDRESAKSIGINYELNYEYYPVYDKFTISTAPKTIGNVTYQPIYEGQKHINLGIKGRPTFDLYLTKDVFNAQVLINGKTETYNYNFILHRKGYYNNGFPIGISEDDYLGIMRSKYTNVQASNFNYNKDTVKNQTYTLEMRPEEVAEGNKDSYIGKTGVSSSQGTYKESNNPTQLEVKIKYKISITNESSVLGGPTEIVDYFDDKYDIDALEGNIGGRAVTIKKVDKNNNYMDCKYGENTRFTSDKYETIYLQPSETNGDPIKLKSNETLDIYVTLKLKDASKTLINSGLLEQTGELRSINVAEINGYKTYETTIGGEKVWGLIDKDSTPGNLDIRNVNFTEAGVNQKDTEDDGWRAPAFIYKKRQSKTIEGIVFEDKTGDQLQTGAVREGNGIYNSSDDTTIQGVIVQLVDVNKNEVVAQTTTNSDGWYGFVGFVAGNYKVQFIYGYNDDTAMATNSKIGVRADNDIDITRHEGLNVKSYNGQDFQSTSYPNRDYKDYWYDEDNRTAIRYSDATDTQERIGKVKEYSNSAEDVAIVNHKAEVFNSYRDQTYYDSCYPVMNEQLWGQLQCELKKNTYREAETPIIIVEVEQAKPTVDGNQGSDYYIHQISNIDFGVAERPRSELTIDQDVKHIKVTAADGTILFDTEQGVNNLQWIEKGDIRKYDKKELINIIMDEELISGSTLEITYNITVANNGEIDNRTLDSKPAKTRAKNIINYVANNLTFDKDENPYWEEVSISTIQKNSVNGKYDNTTWINSRGEGNSKYIDLSTQQTIIKARQDNQKTSPLLQELSPKESKTVELKLKKVLSTEGVDDLKYTNMTEIVEIENAVGRYDYGAIPGNQDLTKNPTEHDTSGASSEAEKEDDGYTDQDGTVIVTPPQGSKIIYYTIGITATVILAAGIYLIKKFVIDRK